MSRIDHTGDFMQYVMTPPVQECAAYEQYLPKTSTMRMLSRSNGEGLSGLSQVPMVGGSSEQNSWVMPVVVIVVSAMALMFVYAVLHDRKR